MRARLRSRWISVMYHRDSHGEWRPVPVTEFRYAHTADMLNDLSSLQIGWATKNWHTFETALSDLWTAQR